MLWMVDHGSSAWAPVVTMQTFAVHDLQHCQQSRTCSRPRSGHGQEDPPPTSWSHGSSSLEHSSAVSSSSSELCQPPMVISLSAKCSGNCKQTRSEHCWSGSATGCAQLYVRCAYSTSSATKNVNLERALALYPANISVAAKHSRSYIPCGQAQTTAGACWRFAGKQGKQQRPSIGQHYSQLRLSLRLKGPVSTISVPSARN